MVSNAWPPNSSIPRPTTMAIPFQAHHPECASATGNRKKNIAPTIGWYERIPRGLSEQDRLAAEKTPRRIKQRWNDKAWTLWNLSVDY